MWSRVPRDSDPRKAALTKASIIYKRQTRPLVREGAPQEQYLNCQRVINIWSWAPDGARHQDLLSDWPSVVMWLWLWLELGQCSVVELSKLVVEWVSELEDCCESVLTTCYCGKLVAEARGQFGNPEEGECPPLEAVTRRQQVKIQQTEKT
jgi:hypothetical protein